MRISRLACVLVVLIACDDAGERLARAALISVRIVDSSNIAAVWNPMAESLKVYRVVLRGASAADTLTNLLTLPFQIGGDSIAGLRAVPVNDASSERHVFLYSFARQQMTSTAVPADVWAFYEDVALSPDGRLLAYVATDDDANGTTYPIARSLTDGRIIARGPAGGGCDCDVDMNHARWLSADSVEIAVKHSDDFEGWLLFALRVSSGRVHLDTLAVEPSWHPPAG